MRHFNVPLILGVAVFLILVQTSCVYLNHNFREVEPHALYRSGQIPDDRLAQFIHRHEIRTVVNLRGVNPEEAWYQREKAVCEASGVAHHDLSWTMRQIPEPASIETLIEIYQTADRPILVHCQGGTHRAAIASALFLLAEGEPLDRARGEIGFFFNDAPIGEMLDLYEASGAEFRDWLRDYYPDQYAEWSRTTLETAESDAP